MKKMSFFFFFGVSSRRSCRSSFQLSNLKKKKKSPLSLSVFPFHYKRLGKWKYESLDVPVLIGALNHVGLRHNSWNIIGLKTFIFFIFQSFPRKTSCFRCVLPIPISNLKLRTLKGDMETTENLTQDNNVDESSHELTFLTETETYGAPGCRNLSQGPHFLFVGNRLQSPWPSLSFKGQTGTAASQGRWEEQSRNKNEALVHSPGSTSRYTQNTIFELFYHFRW